MTTITRTVTVDEAGLDEIRRPRCQLVSEVLAAPDRFVAEIGPFDDYERTLVLEQLGPQQWSVTETTRYRLAVRYWRPLLALPVRHRLRRPDGGGGQPVWAPAERLDARAARVLSTLAVLAVVMGYLSTLIGQTMTFAATEFGADDRSQGFAFASIRAGALIALCVVGVADRSGRRRAIVGSAALGVLATATGALATSIEVLTVSQIIGRSFATALVILLPVSAAEEMPAGSRAFAVSILSICSAFGAGIAVAALPLADLGERGWRLLFLVPLLSLPVIVDVGRTLPESRRFVAHQREASMARDLVGHRGRLALLAATGFLINVMVAPAAQFRNEYLSDIHGFSATDISIFILVTSAPAGIGVLIGGQLADRQGRRVLAGAGTALGAITTAAFFLSSGGGLWALALSGTVVGAIAAPAVKVYEPELFPTRLRGRANGIITAVTLGGSVVGLVVTGVLSDVVGGLGRAIALTALFPLVAGIVILLRYPETSRVELETLNPQDRPEVQE